MTKGNN